MMVVLSEREQNRYMFRVVGVKRSYVPLVGEVSLSAGLGLTWDECH